ncbi:MAG: HAD family hydrolase [Chloroflexi bacterium]|nr:HAD family hydrolase [Chloroflexota bacterium]
MATIKVVSLDMEGTLVTLTYSHKVWHEGIPDLYARKVGIGFREAKRLVQQQYDDVGEARPEWYDINYWFTRFGLSDPQRLLEDYGRELAIYPEVKATLQRLSKDYCLVVASNSARDFLQVMTKAVGNSFKTVFSAISDGGQLKTEGFFLRICRETGVTPAEVVHVGDHLEYDFHAPRRAGLHAFHLDRSQKTSGDSVVKDLEEFEERLNELSAISTQRSGD